MKKPKESTLNLIWIGVSILAFIAVMAFVWWLVGEGEVKVEDEASKPVTIAYAKESDNIVWIGNEGVINAPKKKGAGVEQQKLIDYAWFISGDRDFVYLIEAESGWRDIVSAPNRDGTRDHGYAQINEYWHKNIVADPRFKDPYWQIEQAYKLYTGGTPFYGKAKIPVAKNNFNDSQSLPASN